MQYFFKNNCICAIKFTQKKPNGLSKTHPALWQYEYSILAAQSMYFWRILECVLLLSKTAENPILTGFCANWVQSKTSKKPVFMRTSTTFVLLYHIPQFFWQCLLLSYYISPFCYTILQTVMLVSVKRGDLYCMGLLLDWNMI